ncbi:MAG: glycosyltransferase family 4 protein [Chitinophagales bacterium]|nr:glycosyltransferase family 4 protein [Chitinophagales bacterium]
MLKDKKIVCVHLLNDFSGSPRILSQVVKAFVNEGSEVDLYTCKSKNKGFLSDIPGVNYRDFYYRWSSNKMITLVFFLFSQFLLFFKMMKYMKKDVIFYINTILPFGVALAAKLMNKKVVYHVHETSVKPEILKKFLFRIVRYTASDAIYVSNFLLQQEEVPNVNCHVVHNALTDEFIAESSKFQPSQHDGFTVLMLSSLKRYKGIHDFVTLAKSLPDLKFELVINAKKTDINNYFRGDDLPANLIIYPSQSNVHQFYKRANLVLNLSHPLGWVETFGMTALEAMSYGIPVIVPPVGGIAEIVEEGFCGRKIDVRNINSLIAGIQKFCSDSKYYLKLSNGARRKSEQFIPQKMTSRILKIAS